MKKLTAEQIAAEMDAFEKLYPIPRYTSRCGNGYAVSEFNAWDGHEYCNMWKGWIARAEIALPALEQQDDYFGSLVLKARESAKKAMVKFPQPNYVLLKVAEEAGEVVQAGVHYAENRMSWQEVEGEVVQLMAMLFRLMNEGDQINGVIPPQPTTGTYRQIENDGWIEWDGGVMPVHEDTLLEVRFSDGGEDGPAPAYSWHWNHMGHSRDVFAYRVIENDGREG